MNEKGTLNLVVTCDCCAGAARVINNAPKAIPAAFLSVRLVIESFLFWRRAPHPIRRSFPAGSSRQGSPPRRWRTLARSLAFAGVTFGFPFRQQLGLFFRSGSGEAGAAFGRLGLIPFE